MGNHRVRRSWTCFVGQAVMDEVHARVVHAWASDGSVPRRGDMAWCLAGGRRDFDLPGHGIPYRHHHRQRSSVGGWKAPTVHVRAPTGALVVTALSHLVGARLSLKVTLAGQPLEFEVPGNGGAGGGRAHASLF